MDYNSGDFSQESFHFRICLVGVQNMYTESKYIVIDMDITSLIYERGSEMKIMKKDYVKSFMNPINPKMKQQTMN